MVKMKKNTSVELAGKAKAADIVDVVLKTVTKVETDCLILVIGTSAS